MEQLIFIGVLVLFSILDGVARKKKREQQARQASYDLTPQEEAWKWEPAGESLSAYDADVSVPDEDEIPAEPLPADTRSYGSQAQQPARAAPAVPSLIPKDIWEEIAALASGNAPSRPEPEPQQAYLVPAPVEEPRPTRGPPRPEHRAHLAHAKYGTPVSERLQPMDRPEMHQAAGPSEEIRAVWGLLAGGGASLRQAVILQEVLGVPVSLRDEPGTGRI